MAGLESGWTHRRAVTLPNRPPLEIEEGHRAVYVLDERGTADRPEYVYVFVPERM